MTDQTDIVELPAIPSDAPEWVRALPTNGRFVDRGKLYDITGHLLFDSLLNSNGIRHFFYFMGTEKQAERVVKALNGLSTSPRTHDDPTNHEKEEVQVAFHLGEGICGHKGIVHGGLTATMIDEVSGAAAFSCVGPCFTANLNIDYIKPLFTPAWVLVRAHVERNEGRKVFVHASVENGEGGIYAKAVVLFIKPKTSVQDLVQQK
jgi:acyl-coenzyme A thioesterase PaaI-like protein